MMTLTTAVSRVASRLNKDANNTVVYSRIKNHINDACLEKWNGFHWSFRYREYPITLSARVTSGTMTATNASQAITASGTPFVSGTHEGAWIRFTADTIQAWYRIITVGSTSTATIEPAYQGTTGSSKAYELIKTDYLLPSEVLDVGYLNVMYNRTAIPITHQLQSDPGIHPPLSVGAPFGATILNQSQSVSTYTTGTVSGTIDTTTLTGSGTSWLANVVPGDEVAINGDSNTYTVYQVTSDTSITLYNKLVAAAAAGTTYTISRQFGKVLRITDAPDNPYVIFVKGLRRYPALVNEDDTNELLARYPQAVIEGAVWREAGSSPDPREDGLYMRSEMLWAQAQGQDEAMFPRNNYEPIWNPRQCR